MTIEDANRLLGIAKANYSYAFKSMSREDKVLLVKSWAFALADIPSDIVTIAFMKLLSTCKWLPTVAEIREKVKDLYYDAEYEAMEEGVSRRRLAEIDYIRSATSFLRGDSAPEIALGALLDGPIGRAIGSGDTKYLTEEEELE